MATATPDPKPVCLPLRQAAKALGISARTLWKLLRPRGPIPAIRLPGKTLIRLVDLEAWAAREAGRQEGQP
jgi:excisionase family DNA binding protein